MSVEKSADDGRLIFLFEVSNFYVTNITVGVLIKMIYAKMTFAETKVSLYFFIRILPIMGMNTCKVDY